MTPLNPYLFKAYYQWLRDNQFSVILVAKADGMPDPIAAKLTNGEYVFLDMHPTQVHSLEITPTHVHYKHLGMDHSQRFEIPFTHILALQYTGHQGYTNSLPFPPMEVPNPPEPQPRRRGLSVVK